VTSKRKGWSRWKKNFLLHKSPKFSKMREWRFFPVVQLNLIEGKTSYSSDTISSSEMRLDEIEYVNEFHKENDQPLIWVKESDYKVKKRLDNNH
jgi:hypothetical protein